MRLRSCVAWCMCDSQNIWAFRKRSDEFVVVTFPQSISQLPPSSATKHHHIKPVVRQMLENSSRSYVIGSADIGRFPDSTLYAFLMEHRRRHSSSSSERFYTYEMTDCTFVEFRIIYQIMTR